MGLPKVGTPSGVYSPYRTEELASIWLKPVILICSPDFNPDIKLLAAKSPYILSLRIEFSPVISSV